MSNDDLFEDNDVIIDDAPLSLNDDIDSNTAKNGIPFDAPLSKALQDVVDKLKNVNQFSFAIFSQIYSDFVTLPRAIIPNYYNSVIPSILAPFKAANGAHDIEVLCFLLELQRKILIIGFRHNYTLNLLTILNENTDGEPENSFLLYFRDNLKKEIILNELYLNQLLAVYTGYCEANDIAVDEILVLHQLKTYMSSVEKKEYGTVLRASIIEGIGDFPSYVEHRDNLITEINVSVFKLINKIQSLIDKIRVEAEA